jgi:hypothetical protein
MVREPGGKAMKLGYTLIYAPDVEASLAFFERAFGTLVELCTEI